MSANHSRLQSIRDLIRWGVSRFHGAELFFGHGTDNAWDEARQLVLGGLHLPWDTAEGWLDCRLEADELEAVRVLLQRRIDERIPAAYLLGEAWFCGQPYCVDERVLVPRSPIAELIDKHFEPWLPADPGAHPRPVHRLRLHRHRLRPRLPGGRGGARRPVVRRAGGGQPQHRAPASSRSASTPCRATASTACRDNAST